MTCWSGGYKDASKIAPQLDDSSSEDSGPDYDISYGGWWARDQQILANLSGRGISIFDKTDPFGVLQVCQRNREIKCNDPHSQNQRGGLDWESKNLETWNKVRGNVRDFSDEIDADMHEKLILEKKICHAKSKDEKRRENETNDVSDFRITNLRCLVSNVRGFFSKRESYEAILSRNKVDIAFICETFMTGKRFPEVA